MLRDLAFEVLETANTEKAALAEDDQRPMILTYILGYPQVPRGDHDDALESDALVLATFDESRQQS